MYAYILFRYTIRNMKIRFLEPGNLPYRRSFENIFTYDKYIRTPSHGLLILATIANKIVYNTLIYSESISTIIWDDVLDADIVFISIFTFNANRGYELAQYVKNNSNATVVIGGLHATLNYTEAVNYCDYVILGEGDESILDFINSRIKNIPLNFPGVAFLDGSDLVHTGERKPPENINIVPNRYLMHKYKKMAGMNTLWAQVHCSRGCPHDCNYCSVIQLYGRKVRKRTPENIVEDIKQAIDFYDNRFIPRLSKLLWLTDDNFFADRDWAISVLNKIINSGIKYNFTIQARYEVGFDNEVLTLLKKAGFKEVAMGIEFLEDEAFKAFNKKSSYADIVMSIKNIKDHGLNVRGLFIVGADNHGKGIGKKITDFVIEYGICGVLIQSMYFVPGTPVYEINKDNLIHEDWSKYNGSVVHYPANISPYDLQKEIIYASSKIYSFKRLLRAVFTKRGLERILFVGEFFWHKSTRNRLKKELVKLRNK